MAKKRARRKSTLPARRRTGMLSTRRPVKRRRRTGLSAKEIPVIGELSLRNPLIGGALGGLVASMVVNEIEDNIFGDTTDPESMAAKLAPYAKGIVLAAGAYVAKRSKQPELAAGIMGYAAGKTREKLEEYGVLNESGRFADPSLLSANFSDPSLLSARKRYARR
jgi:hypothetical protein